MRISNILQLGTKELRSLLRDPVMIILIVFAFSAAIYAPATTLPETLSNAPIAIVDEDRSPLSSRIVSAFYPPYFTSPQLINPEEMDKRMDTGKITFAVVIPNHFQRDVLAGRTPAIQVNIDATQMSQSFTGSGYIQTIILKEVREYLSRQRRKEDLPVDFALRVRFNPQLNKTWFGAVMSVIDNITMLAIILTGAALIREREHGTVEHLLVMPVSPAEIMISKVWSMSFVVLLASSSSIFFIVQGLLKVPLAGSMVLFLTGLVLHLFATTSLGIFLATSASSMPQFGLLLVLILLPLQVLSGSVTPREGMPELVQNIMLIAPNTHFVMLSQSIMFRGAGLSVVLPQFLALMAIGTTFFIISLRRFRVYLR